MCSFDVVLSGMDSMYDCLKYSTDGPPTYGQLVFFCENLKMFGPIMEKSHKEYLDRYLDLLRSECRNGNLPSLAKYRFLEVIELRAMRWEKSESHVQYYNKKFASEHEVRQTDQESIRKNIIDSIGCNSVKVKNPKSMTIDGEIENNEKSLHEDSILEDTLSKDDKSQESTNHQLSSSDQDECKSEEESNVHECDNNKEDLELEEIISYNEDTDLDEIIGYNERIIYPEVDKSSDERYQVNHDRIDTCKNDATCQKNINEDHNIHHDLNSSIIKSQEDCNNQNSNNCLKDNLLKKDVITQKYVNLQEDNCTADNFHQGGCQDGGKTDNSTDTAYDVDTGEIINYQKESNYQKVGVLQKDRFSHGSVDCQKDHLQLKNQDNANCQEAIQQENKNLKKDDCKFDESGDGHQKESNCLQEDNNHHGMEINLRIHSSLNDNIKLKENAILQSDKSLQDCCTYKDNGNLQEKDIEKDSSIEQNNSLTSCHKNTSVEDETKYQEYDINAEKSGFHELTNIQQASHSISEHPSNVEAHQYLAGETTLPRYMIPQRRNTYQRDHNSQQHCIPEHIESCQEIADSEKPFSRNCDKLEVTGYSNSNNSRQAEKIKPLCYKDVVIGPIIQSRSLNEVVASHGDSFGKETGITSEKKRMENIIPIDGAITVQDNCDEKENYHRSDYHHQEMNFIQSDFTEKYAAADEDAAAEDSPSPMEDDYTRNKDNDETNYVDGRGCTAQLNTETGNVYDVIENFTVQDSCTPETGSDQLNCSRDEGSTNQEIESNPAEDPMLVIDYRYTLTLGKDAIDITAANLDLLRTAKMALEEYFRNNLTYGNIGSSRKVWSDESGAFSLQSLSSESCVMTEEPNDFNLCSETTSKSPRICNERSKIVSSPTLEPVIQEAFDEVHYYSEKFSKSPERIDENSKSVQIPILEPVLQKSDCTQFASETRAKSPIQTYDNFSNSTQSPIFEPMQQENANCTQFDSETRAKSPSRPYDDHSNSVSVSPIYDPVQNVDSIFKYDSESRAKLSSPIYDAQAISVLSPTFSPVPHPVSTGVHFHPESTLNSSCRSYNEISLSVPSPLFEPGTQKNSDGINFVYENYSNSPTRNYQCSSNSSSPIFDPQICAASKKESPTFGTAVAKNTSGMRTLSCGDESTQRNVFQKEASIAKLEVKKNCEKSGRITYSREFIIRRANHPLSRLTPKKWSDIIWNFDIAPILVKNYTFISGLLDAVNETVDLRIDETQSYLNENELFSSLNFCYDNTSSRRIQ